LSAISALQLLLAGGANPKYATPAWAANHYKWVVWKLAGYDRNLLGGCGALSPTLTADNVLQQLRAR
jgi:breast cancer 2 susceptibility protein